MAVKKIPIEDLATAQREINTVVDLEHKNIINYYNREIDQQKKNVYLGLGYCEGTLKDIINSSSNFELLLKDPTKQDLV